MNATKATVERSLIFVFSVGLLLLFGGQDVVAQQVDDEEKPPKGQLLEAPEITYERDRTSPGLAKDHANADSIIYQEGFEADSSDWTREGTWAIGEPSSGPGSGFNSPSAGATNLSGDHPNDADDRLITPSIALPQVSSSTRILLHVREWFEIESCCDEGIIEVSNDGGSTWTQLSSRSGIQDSWRDIQVDLTQYAGESVQIAFRFTSDGSVVNLGWYVDDLQIDLDIPDPLTTQFTSINPDFDRTTPVVFSNVEVDTFGTGIPSLSESNFEVYEDGVLQSNDSGFDITPPQQGGGTRQVDIVFLMDNSGSMDEEQNAVRENVFNFVDSLSASGVDYALGLTRFGASANSGDPILTDNGSLTQDASYFRNNLWARNTIDGQFEPGWDALHESATGFNFRPGSQKVFILITDENITGSDSNQGTYTKSETEQTLLDQSVTNYSLIDSTNAASRSDYGDIAEATGGRIFDVFSPFTPILNEIGEAVSNSYVVQYTPSNDQRDGAQRTVRVEVSYDGNVAEDTTTYTPGAAPEVARTDTTKALAEQAWAASTEFTIEAIITDDVSPFVQGATLFYKNTSDSVYTSTSMSAVNDSLYEATIPSASVDSPGVDYYITATDGEATVSNPQVGPRSSPHQIAILPNEAPSVDHTPVTTIAPGNDLPIEATITDGTNMVSSTTLFYRQIGDLTFTSVDMTNTSGDLYEATIPGADITQRGIAYYISATDDFGVTTTAGSPDSPILAEVPTQDCPISWSLQVAASDSSGNGNALTLGQSVDATGGLDADCGEDERPPVPPQPETDVRFVDTGISGVDLGNGTLRDIRPSNEGTPDPFVKGEAAAPAVWRVALQSDDYPVTMDWDQSAVVDSLPGETVRLVDAATGGDVVSVDMKEDSSATLSNASVSAVEVRVGQLTGYEMVLVDGWNFRSLPVQPADASFGSVMGPCQSAFGFDSQSGYQPVEVGDSLRTGEGYWFNCSAGTVQISGASPPTLDIDVGAGWNTIGPFPDSVDVSSVTVSGGQISSDFYGFDQTSGYSVAGTLVPTQAYWVKVSQPGTLDLYGAKSKSQSLATTEEEMSGVRLSVEGASGSQATLHLARSLSEDELQRYELPPKPPSGITDVRFESDLRVASFEGGASENAVYRALEVQGMSYPIELRLEGNRQEGEAVQVRWGADRKTTLTGESPSVAIEKKGQLEVGLRAKAAEYFLKGAYPNPATERATIEYGLPEAANVRIEVYDVLGRKVSTLVSGQKRSGIHSLDLETHRLSSGTYFYRMSAGEFVETRKITIAR